MSIIRQKTDDIRAAIAQWLSTASSYQVAEEDQYRPQPNPPFYTYRLLTQLQKLGAYDSVIHSKVDNEFYLVGQRRCTVTVRARGSSPQDSFESYVRGTDMLADAIWQLDKPEIHAVFASYGIAISHIEDVIDTTTFENQALPPRASVDLHLHMALREKIPMQWIEHVSISGALDTRASGVFTYSVGPFVVNVPTT